MNIKYIIITILLLSIVCSCIQKDEYTTVNTNAISVESEILIDESTTLHAYYSLALIDTFIILIDFYNDTIIQLYSLNNPFKLYLQCKR
jgi:hypothetical protein